MVHHPTSRCHVLKNKIQALVEVGISTLKSEQKKFTANMLTLNFGNSPKLIVQDRLVLIPKGKIIVTYPLSEEQKANGLILLTTKSEEVMLVHSDIINDKQSDSSQPKVKDKSCNVISLSQKTTLCRQLLSAVLKRRNSP